MLSRISNFHPSLVQELSIPEANFHPKSKLYELLVMITKVMYSIHLPLACTCTTIPVKVKVNSKKMGKNNREKSCGERKELIYSTFYIL